MLPTLPLAHYEFLQYLCICTQMAQRIMSDLTPLRSRMPKWHFKRSPKLPFVIHVRNKDLSVLTQPYWWALGTCSGNAGMQIYGLSVGCSPRTGASPSAALHCTGLGEQTCTNAGLALRTSFWNPKHPQPLLLCSSFRVLNTDINQSLNMLIFYDFLSW